MRNIKQSHHLYCCRYFGVERINQAFNFKLDSIHPLRKGEIFTRTEDNNIIYGNVAAATGFAFQVIDAVDSDDPSFGYPQNGFQATAVALVINGKVDLNKIVIAYSAPRL